MKRIIAAIIILCFALSMCSCVQNKTYQSLDEAVNDKAKLASNIYIDGVDVSNMDIGQARKALAAALRERLEKLNYTLTVGQKTINISAKELPVNFDLDAAILKAINAPTLKKGERLDLKSAAVIDNAALERRLETIVSELHSSPSDAQYSYSGFAGDSFSYQEGLTGVKVEASGVASSLERALFAGTSAGIRPVADEIPPEYTLDMAMRDTSLIAEFSTSFKGSTYGKKNRVQNIVKAAKLIDGITVAPGEEFDINAVLGRRTEENGWQLATGIRDGKYVQEAGGGVCQVSTTLYNAVLMADLEVSERWHHSWPLGYVPVGRDATISTGGPNFKFKNTSQCPVVISAFADTNNKRITVRIFGRPRTDFSYIEVHSWKTGVISDPGSVVKLDKTLPYGTSVVERESRAGCTSETYKFYYNEAGEVIKKVRVTKDKYKAIKGVKLVSLDVYEASVQTNAIPEITDTAQDKFDSLKIVP